MPKQATMRAIGVTSAPSSPLTAIAPPQDTQSTAPARADEPEAPADAAQTTRMIWDIQRLWYQLSSRAWLRAAGLPIEAATCTSFEDWLALGQRHLTAGMQDLAIGGKEMAAIGAGLRPTSRR